jgi:hypothetical protein
MRSEGFASAFVGIYPSLCITGLITDALHSAFAPSFKLANVFFNSSNYPSLSW